jgi:hypothetical protein
MTATWQVVNMENPIGPYVGHLGAGTWVWEP